MEIYKTFIVVLFIAILGCTSQRRQSHQAESSVSLDTLQKLPSRLAKLQPGMSSERVWEQLGLPSGKFGGVQGGPPEHYREEYLLPHGYVLTLVFDYSKGDFWKRTGGIFLYGGCYNIGNKGDTERKVMISELIEVITNAENQVRNPDAVKKAMLSLGEIRAEEGIKTLVNYIGFPSVRQPGVKQDLISFQRKPSPVIEERLPAVAALLKIGASCIDEVIRKLAVTDDATEVIACVRVLQVSSAPASVNAKLQKALKQGSKVEKKRINRALELMRRENVR